MPLSCPGITTLFVMVIMLTRLTRSFQMLGSWMPVGIDCTVKSASQCCHTLMISNERARACVFFQLGTLSDYLLYPFRPPSKQNRLYSTHPDSFYLLFLFSHPKIPWICWRPLCARGVVCCRDSVVNETLNSSQPHDVNISEASCAVDDSTDEPPMRHDGRASLYE